MKTLLHQTPVVPVACLYTAKSSINISSVGGEGSDNNDKAMAWIYNPGMDRKKQALSPVCPLDLAPKSQSMLLTDLQ